MSELYKAYGKFALTMHVLEVDVELLKCTFILLTTRLDLLHGTFGHGTQYYSLWGSILQQLYFFLRVLDDLNYFPKDSKVKILPYIFHHVIFPMNLIAAINYWSISSIDPTLLDYFGVLDNLMYQTMMDQHVLVLLLGLVESMLINVKPLSAKLTLYSMILMSYFYLGIVYFYFYLNGKWAYPLFERKPFYQLALLSLVNALTAALFTHFLWPIRQYITANG